MISVTIDGATAAELQAELRALLNGEGRSTGPATGEQTGVSGGTAQTNEPRLTAAQKKAAEKAAKEAAAAAATTTTGQGISTGEERVDPADAAQDAKDEAADTAKQKAADPVKLTHDDVKKMLGGYVMAYGMEAAQADGVGFIGAPKLSSIPDTQADLAKAIIGIAQGIEKNPNKREIAGDGITAEKLAELKPIVAAALAVK